MRRTRALFAAAACSAALAATATACGGDDAPLTPDAGGTDASLEADAPLPAPPLYDGGADTAARPATCGANECKAEDFRGVATLRACCADGGGCGVDLAAAGPFVPVAPVCMPRENPGVADDGCPTYAAPSALYPGDFIGCCRADRRCGVFVRLTPTLDLGCVPAGDFLEDAAAPTPCAFEAGVDDAGPADAGDGG